MGNRNHSSAVANALGSVENSHGSHCVRCKIGVDDVHLMYWPPDDFQTNQTVAVSLFHPQSIVADGFTL